MEEKAFLGRRRDRAIATILGYKEREIDQYLPDDVARKFRNHLLDQINELVDTAFDLISSGGVINQEYLDRINAVYEVLVGDEYANSVSSRESRLREDGSEY